MITLITIYFNNAIRTIKESLSLNKLKKNQYYTTSTALVHKIHRVLEL